MCIHTDTDTHTHMFCGCCGRKKNESRDNWGAIVAVQIRDESRD